MNMEHLRCRITQIHERFDPIGSLPQDVHTGNSSNLFVRMSPLSVALRKKNSALYVDIKSASVVLDLWKLKLFLMIESRRASTPADAFDQYP